MTEKSRDMSLLQQFQDDPEKFDSDGKAYDLLQEYFRGKPVETLRPFLKHKSVAARRSAAFIAAELGRQGCSLILDVVPLIKDEDLHIQWYALEAVMVYSENGSFEQFVNVVQELENPNDSICDLAMRLVANANPLQLAGAIRSIEPLKSHDIDHKRGLKLLAQWKTVSASEIIDLLDDASELSRKYGAILAKKRLEDWPQLIQHARRSDIEVISRFAEEAMQES